MNDSSPDRHPEHLIAARILDANANRAREGLRVAEEYARFALNDHYLTSELKSVRHALQSALAHVPLELRMKARDTARDVGTQVTTATEYARESVAAVAAANLSRVQEALRSIEEYSKTQWPDLAQQVEVFRYRLYVLAQAVFHVGQARLRLGASALYALVDAGRDEEDFTARCRAILSGGVQIVQLRAKRLDDRTRLSRAQLLRRITADFGAIFIVNDRPDIAKLARADGVHVGQDELRVSDVRAILGADGLVGVSTHSIEQAHQAILDGADYIGCGPTFASRTKSFDSFPGLDYLRQVSHSIGLPAFAIGGIDVARLPEVLATGIRRVAVGNALWDAPDPELAARELASPLREASTWNAEA